MRVVKVNQEGGRNGSMNFSLKVRLVWIVGLKLYGRNWQLVEKHVGTRTGVQVRSHAQKHFIRERAKLTYSNLIKVKDEEEELQANMEVGSCAKKKASVKILNPNEV